MWATSPAADKVVHAIGRQHGRGVDFFWLVKTAGCSTQPCEKGISMKKQKSLKAVALLMACTAPLAAQADSWFDDTYVAPMFSYSLADHDRPTDDGLGGTLGAGWRLSKGVELELLGTYLKYKDDGGTHSCGLFATCDNKSQTVSGGGFGTNLFLGLFGERPFGGPFIHLDVMASNKDKLALYHAGPGLDWAFGDNGWALRTEALVQLNGSGDYIDWVFNVGVRIPLGPHRIAYVPPPQPAPPAVVPAPPPPPPPPPPPCELPKSGEAVDFTGCKAGDVVILRGVNFEFDKWTLTVEAKGLLDQVAAALMKRGDIKVEIDGHTDSKGSDAYNLKLSDRRAKSVMDYLLGKGIAPMRMNAKGFGESVPIADNKSDEGRALNRRVELKVLDADAPVTVEQAGRAAQTYGDSELPAGAAAAPPPTEMPMSHAPPPDAQPAAASAPGTVSIDNFAFSPEVLTVAAGSTVTFINNDGSNHIVQFADGQASPRLAMGKSWQRSFATPGEYPYACAIHTTMKGKIIVQ